MTDFGLVAVLAACPVVYAGHMLACFTQSSLHRWLGHTPTGGKIYRIHTASHHSIYTDRNMASESYSDYEISLTPFFLIPVFALCALSSLILPPVLAAVFTFSLFASFLVQIYLHAQYHVSDSWLKRYKWFVRLLRLHTLHHRDQTKNYGLVNFMPDRIYGTYRAETRSGHDD